MAPSTPLSGPVEEYFIRRAPKAALLRLWPCNRMVKSSWEVSPGILSPLISPWSVFFPMDCGIHPLEMPAPSSPHSQAAAPLARLSPFTTTAKSSLQGTESDPLQASPWLVTIQTVPWTIPSMAMEKSSHPSPRVGRLPWQWPFKRTERSLWEAAPSLTATKTLWWSATIGTVHSTLPMATSEGF